MNEIIIFAAEYLIFFMLVIFLWQLWKIPRKGRLQFISFSLRAVIIAFILIKIAKVAWNPENTTQPPTPALSVSYYPQLTQFVYSKYHPSADTKYYTVTSNNKIRSYSVTGYDTSKVSIKTNADMTNDTEIQFKIDLLADLNVAQVGQTAASVEITDEYNQISIIPIKVEWAIKDIVINLE